MKTACRKAFTEELLQLARQNRNILALTSDSMGSVTLNNFAAELPDQLIEAGIAEQNVLGIAGGLAACGKIPFVCAPAPFLSARGYEQIKIDVAYNDRNVKVIGVSGGISYGTLGASHHSLQDIAALRAIPGLTVLVPSDAAQTRYLTRRIAASAGPVFMRMGRGAVPDLYTADVDFTLGKAKTVADGCDLTIIAMGEMVWVCREASVLLKQRGVSARVLDMFTIKPLDEQAIIAAARETGRIVTAEEHSVLGGLGGAVCEVTSQYRPVPVLRIGAPDAHIAAGESPELYAHYGWTPEAVAKKVMGWLSAPLLP